MLAVQGAPRSFISSGLIRHPKLSAIPHGHFFQLCREENFIFDIESFQGPIFSLVDTLLKGVIGVTFVLSTFLLCLCYLSQPCVELLSRLLSVYPCVRILVEGYLISRACFAPWGLSVCE